MAAVADLRRQFCRSTKHYCYLGFVFSCAPKLTGRDLTEIDEWLADLCANQRIPPFRVSVQEGDLANAFATAGGYSAHLVVIGGGLIDGMSSSQITAVLAHEMAHVIKRDVPRLLLPLAVGIMVPARYCASWLFANPLFETNTVSGILAGCGHCRIAVAGLFIDRNTRLLHAQDGIPAPTVLPWSCWATAKRSMTPFEGLPNLNKRAD